ncbi:hypothetical protein ABVW88_04445, partial [Enterobacter cloacae subsp. cloacae]
MVLANRCHRQNMKTSIINGSEVSRLSVAIQGGYRPTGKAFTTLGEYSTQSRRHAEISKLQSGTVRATALAAIAAIASATPVIMLYLAKLFNTIKALL